MRSAPKPTKMPPGGSVGRGGTDIVKETATSGVQTGPHLTHRFLDAGEQGAAHDAVADVELVQVRQQAHLGDVDVIDPVPGIDDEPRLVGGDRTDPQTTELFRAARRVERIGPRPRVEFNQWSPDLGAGGDLRLVGIDEEADLDPRGTQGVDTRAHAVAVTGDVESALGRDLLTALRYHANVLGPQFEGESRHLRRAGHLEVQPGGDAFAQPEDVSFLDMTPVLAQMDGDTVGPGAFGRHGEGHGIGFDRAAGGRGGAAIARLAHGGTVIDVNAEQDHRRCEWEEEGSTGTRKTRRGISLCGRDLSPLAAGMSTPPPKRESLLLNLACNIALPTLVLTKLSGEDRLGPMWGMVVALAFPFGYGVVDVIRRRKTNFFSIVGVLSVLLTGGLNQLKADVFWFAVKEAAVPALFGVAVVWSGRTKRPLVRELLWNEQVIDTARVDAVLTERNQHAAFERLLARATNGLAVSFLLSAVLNYGLARYLLKSAPGTEAFNAELGRMNLLSWPVIILPYMAITMYVLWRLLNGFTQLTGLQLEEVFHGAKKETAAVETAAKD